MCFIVLYWCILWDMWYVQIVYTVIFFIDLIAHCSCIGIEGTFSIWILILTYLFLLNLFRPICLKKAENESIQNCISVAWYFQDLTFSMRFLTWTALDFYFNQRIPSPFHSYLNKLIEKD